MCFEIVHLHQMYYCPGGQSLPFDMLLGSPRVSGYGVTRGEDRFPHDSLYGCCSFDLSCLPRLPSAPRGLVVDWLIERGWFVSMVSERLCPPPC